MRMAFIPEPALPVRRIPTALGRQSNVPPSLPTGFRQHVREHLQLLFAGIPGRNDPVDQPSQPSVPRPINFALCWNTGRARSPSSSRRRAFVSTCATRSLHWSRPQARVDAAQKARDLAQHTFDITKQEQQLGAMSSVRYVGRGKCPGHCRVRSGGCADGVGKGQGGHRPRHRGDAGADGRLDRRCKSRRRDACAIEFGCSVQCIAQRPTPSQSPRLKHPE